MMCLSADRDKGTEVGTCSIYSKWNGKSSLAKMTK